MAEETCVTCKYYNSDDETCRRYPPTLRPKNPAGARFVTDYPEVNWDDFCGDYEEKEE